MIEPLGHAHLAFRGSKLAFFFFFSPWDRFSPVARESLGWVQ